MGQKCPKTSVVAALVLTAAFACVWCRSLTVWLNGERRAVMVPSGLVGPLRWAVDLWNQGSVRVDGHKPPPMIVAD